MAATSPEPKAPTALRQISGFTITAIDRTAAAAAILGGICLVAILVMMLAEIIARSFIGYGLKFSWELSGYAMAAVFFLPSGYALKHGAHVRTSAVEMIAGGRFTKHFDVVCYFVAVIMLGYGTWAMSTRAVASFQAGTESWAGIGVQLWIPEAVIAAGLLVFAAQCVAELLRLLVLRQHIEISEETRIGTSL